jgi:hypothetical protein
VTLTFSRISLAAPLFTLAEAKAELGIVDPAHDAVVARKLAEAEEMTLAYLALAVDPAWSSATAPEAVKSAVLALLVHLYEHRGDDFGPGSRDVGVIWRELQHRLSHYRDPSLG